MWNAPITISPEPERPPQRVVDATLPVRALRRVQDERGEREGGWPHGGDEGSGQTTAERQGSQTAATPAGTGSARGAIIDEYV